MIKVSDLSFTRADKQIFTGFNFELPSKSATLLSGANGSGKTTLLNLIGGVLTPHSGSITINELDVSRLSVKDQAKLRSVAPQRRIFDLSFRVSELLAIIRPKMRSQYYDLVIEELNLNELISKKITELSLGQQQRVSVALALIQQAEYYLLDEPFSAQDSEYTSKLLGLLLELKKEKGILVITHNSEFLKKNFDSIKLLS
jgi:putative ABC transport system ATP-binding protein